jgi:glutathione S-transferase
MVHAAMLSRIRRLAGGSEKTGYGAGACETILETRLAALEDHLADGRAHMTGEGFTIADISVGYALAYARMRELDGMFGPNTQAYVERVTTRPGYRVADSD